MKLFIILLLSASAVAAEPDAAGDWLARIEARAADVDTLRAKIQYTTIQGLLGDEQMRIGTLRYDDADAGVPARFAVRFDRIIVDQAMQMQDRSYIYDGVWLAERIEEDDRKVFIRRQLVNEAEQGQDNDLMSLGEGPFVLPLNLKKDQVRRKYEVSLVPAGDDDADSVHLRLIPRPGVRIEQEQIDLWFDVETLLPVRVHTLNNDESESIVVLRAMEVNPELDGEPFDTTPPHGGGWEVEIKPLKAEGPAR